MVLEDDRQELARLQTAIEEQLPVRVISLYDADAAIRLLNVSTDKFVAYVLDIEMAGQQFSGIQVAEAIRKRPDCATVPIIFLTSYMHFGAGALHHLHYYDFLKKSTDTAPLINSLRNALGLQNSIPTLPADSRHIVLVGKTRSLEWEVSNISCIEIIGSEILITDLLGTVYTYRVKARTFANICAQLAGMPGHSLRQVHRSVIINVNRIKDIYWAKNLAMVQLFNVKDRKPVGKTYLDELAIYKQTTAFSE